MQNQKEPKDDSNELIVERPDQRKDETRIVIYCDLLLDDLGYTLLISYRDRLSHEIASRVQFHCS